MLSVSDFKVSITSIEFSLFFQQSCALCPNCGQLLDNNPFSEVKLSSLVLLLGVGSLVCYKYIKDRENQKKRKQKRELVLVYNNSENNELFEENHNFSEDSKIRKGYNLLTSTPFVGLCGSADSTPSLCSDGSDLGFNLTDISDENDGSHPTPSFSKIGNQTVAKLDQLLDQIQDIKRSVYEIDSQIFDVKEPNIAFEPKMFSLGPEMSSSLNTDSDLNEKFNDFNTEPQTPTLEWDLTDLNGFNGLNSFAAINGMNAQINEKQLLLSLNSSQRHQSFDRSSGQPNHNESNRLEPQDLSSPSISTSGEFSISSSSESIKANNLETILRMISDAKKLGLLKDLIDVLIKSSKRDSAFFED